MSFEIRILRFFYHVQRCGYQMSEAERIKKDIALFEESVNALDSISLAGNAAETICDAKRYYKDTKYYLEKGDYFTAFGCINYAHGLIDGIKKMKS